MDKMRQWSILTAVAVIAVMAAGWFLLVSPQRSHVSSLHSQAVSQTQANQSLQTQVTQLEDQKKGEPAEQRKEADIDAKVPDNPALPTLIRQLSAAAVSAGVSLTSIAPGAPAADTAAATAPTTTTTTTGTTTTGTTPTAGAPAAPAAALAKIPVSVTVTGSYANIQRFFHSVESLTRATTVDGWTLTTGGTASSTSAAPSAGGTSSSSSSSTGVNGLTSTLSASVYMAVPPSATTQSAPVAAGQ